MPEETRSELLLIEIAELYDRARRAINEAHRLAGDHDFILWWYGIRPRFRKRPVALLDE